MADVRALLKAKRQEARITHPYATYNSSGQLKCSVCSSIVKHASAWEGHLGSKLHRTNVARMREEERRQREQQTLEPDPEPEPTIKRKASVDADSPAEKKRKVDQATTSAQSFPQDFFSDPSRAPVMLSEEEDEEEEDNPAPQAQSTTAATTVDLEYERFQRELLATPATDPTEAYERATVFAEPVVASTEVAGFPVNAPEAAPEPVELTSDEIRQVREQEDRELIMDRLLDEERAQEDVDTRVQLMKTKVDALRKRRELAKAKKVTTAG